MVALITFCRTFIQCSCHDVRPHTLVLSFQARTMTMRVRRPVQGTLRKKIRPYATQSKKVKSSRKPNCFLRSCARKKLNQSRKRYQNMRRDQSRQTISSWKQSDPGQMSLFQASQGKFNSECVLYGKSSVLAGVPQRRP